MADNTITIVGNLTADPELRFTPSGHQVANFSIAVNKRVKDGADWKDELEGFFRCTVWRELAQNVAESLTKGTRVVVVGRLQQSTWQADDGSKRSAVEITADEVAPSLRWSTAVVTKAKRSDTQAQEQTSGQGGDWSTPATAGQAAF